MARPSRDIAYIGADMSEYRTAFITGASSGIGAALARTLAARGVEVVLAARRRELLEEVAASIASVGGKAHVVPLDVSEPETVVARMRETDDAIGGIDLVIANAGISQSKWAGKLELDDVLPTLQINAIGAAATLTAVLPRMLERGRGHLVGISSLAAYRGLRRAAAYSASKACLSTMLESFRVDLAHTEVAVTDVRPGFIATPLTAGRKSLPFLLDVETAAERIVRAIEARTAVYAFPFPIAWGARFMSTIPNAFYHSLASRSSS